MSETFPSDRFLASNYGELIMKLWVNCLRLIFADFRIFLAFVHRISFPHFWIRELAVHSRPNPLTKIYTNFSITLREIELHNLSSLQSRTKILGHQTSLFQHTGPCGRRTTVSQAIFQH